MSADSGIAYWNVNVPASERTRECPDYLAGLDQFDRAQLAVPNEQYRRMSWDSVCTIIEQNRLEQFKRTPLDLRNYRKYMGRIKEQYGSVMTFIMQERVRWDDLKPKGQPFEYAEDIRVLRNDWREFVVFYLVKEAMEALTRKGKAYGIDPKIVHLVIWVKFALAEDPITGDLTPASRSSIEQYVNHHFSRPLGDPSRVKWFKNWSALKSVHAVEHFHVMLYDPDVSLVERMTNGDEAMADKTRSEQAS